jgi:uncharacterized repeat protein (TIGR03806 family)
MLTIKSEAAAICFTSLFSLIVISVISCNGMDEITANQMLPRLSDYLIFKGSLSNLVPNDNYKLYELSSGLFTDYAEKQRLIKVPSGAVIKAADDGLVSFPEGTIIVKTFYYFNDKRDPSKGKKIIETRLLVKEDGQWRVGVFKWNEAQTDAYLFTSGNYQTVNWIDSDGHAKVISYQIPGNTDCRTCHQSGNNITPIGLKMRNLNIDVLRNGASVNQLTYLSNEGFLDTANPSLFSVLPNYHDISLNAEQRARAYFDINCAHCHSQGGFASNRGPRFGYENSLESSMISEQKSDIIQKMEDGEMPKLGTSVPDDEGIELVKKYLNSL